MPRSQNHGSYALIEGRKWAIYSLGSDLSFRDEDNVMVRAVHWRDSWFFKSELPKAKEHITSFENRMRRRHTTCFDNTTADGWVLPRSQANIEHMPDRFIQQSAQDLEKARAIVEQHWPNVPPTNDVDLYLAMWGKIYETRDSANRGGKSFVELLNRKQVRPLRWSHPFIDSNLPYRIDTTRPEQMNAILLQCTDDLAEDKCEKCALGHSVFAECVAQKSQVWANGGCAGCYAYKAGTSCVWHRGSERPKPQGEHIPSPNNGPCHRLTCAEPLPQRSQRCRAAKVVQSVELDCRGQARIHGSWHENSESELDSDSEAALPVRHASEDDDESGDFVSRKPHEPTASFSEPSHATRRVTSSSGASSARRSSQRYRSSCGKPAFLPGSSASRTVAGSRSLQKGGGDKSRATIGSGLGPTSDTANIEVLDMTSSDLGITSVVRARGVLKRPSTQRKQPDQHNASPQRSSPPNIERFMASLSRENAESSRDQDVFDFIDHLASHEPANIQSASHLPGAPASSSPAGPLRPGVVPCDDARNLASGTVRLTTPPSSPPSDRERLKRKSSSSSDLYNATPMSSPARRAVARRAATSKLGTAPPPDTAFARQFPSSSDSTPPVNQFEQAARPARQQLPAITDPQLLTPSSSSNAAPFSATINPPASPQVTSLESPRFTKDYLHDGCRPRAPCAHPVYPFSSYASTRMSHIAASKPIFSAGQLSNRQVRFILHGTTCFWTEMFHGLWERQPVPHLRYDGMEKFLSRECAKELWKALRAAEALKPVHIDLTV